MCHTVPSPLRIAETARGPSCLRGKRVFVQPGNRTPQSAEQLQDSPDNVDMSLPVTAGYCDSNNTPPSSQHEL
jgi:hypothetical protein